MIHDLIDEECPYYKLFKLIEGKGKVRIKDAAFFYCPYIPLTITGVIDSKLLKPVTSFNTRYGTLNNLVKVYTP